MVKSIFSYNYEIFLELIRQRRKRVGLTQEQVAERIGQDQSFVSKCERGERQVDFVEMMAFCNALGITLSDFALQFEQATKLRQEK